MILILSLSALLALCSALPHVQYGPETLEAPFLDLLAAGIRETKENVDVQNVVVVPPNCPIGQALVNGVCHDVWKTIPSDKVMPFVKLECPVGYAVVGGECIDWLRNIVTVPSNCPEGQVWINGACRDVWRAPEKVLPVVTLECPVGYSLVAGECTVLPRNVVTVPDNCPPGQILVNGSCRDVWRLQQAKLQEAELDSRNTVVVPENCKPNQQWINGQCRDVWRSGSPQF